MNLKFENGKWYHIDSGEEATAQEVAEFRKELQWYDKEEANKNTSAAINNRTPEIEEKVRKKILDEEIEKMREQIKKENGNDPETIKKLNEKLAEAEQAKEVIREQTKKEEEQARQELLNENKSVKQKFEKLYDATKRTREESTIKTVASNFRFVNPQDLVDKLESKRIWVKTDEIDPDTGLNVEVAKYNLPMADENGQEKIMAVDIKKAAELIAENNTHLIAPMKKDGFGNNFTGNTSVGAGKFNANMSISEIQAIKNRK